MTYRQQWDQTKGRRYAADVRLASDAPSSSVPIPKSVNSISVRAINNNCDRSTQSKSDLSDIPTSANEMKLGQEASAATTSEKPSEQPREKAKPLPTLPPFKPRKFHSELVKLLKDFDLREDDRAFGRSVFTCAICFEEMMGADCFRYRGEAACPIFVLF